jgi:threonine aldolase
LALHLDGARIFNAAVALGVRPADLVREADSVQFCLSKGLSAPIGSLIAGNGEFIERARKYRKMVGGGMRQVGIIAAAGIVALEEMVDRLAEDHATARRLALGLAAIRGIFIDPDAIETNILFYRLSGIAPADFVNGLRERNIFVGSGRMVTHYGITPDDVDAMLEEIRTVVLSLESVSAG